MPWCVMAAGMKLEKADRSMRSPCDVIPGLTLALALVLLPQHWSEAAERLRPPVAERKPVTLQHHGITFMDDYAWMRTQKLEEVLQRPEALEEPIRQHLEAESRYA